MKNGLMARRREDICVLRLRARKILAELKKLFPRTGITLRYENTWELLVAVILSAQCTDKMVNKVTEGLFKKYRTIDDYARAHPAEFEKNIYRTGLYRNKTKNIIAAAKKIRDEFGGSVPDTMRELISLPGVARKTANVVLGNAFGKIEGIAVDTHVKRFARKFRLSAHGDPKKIEKDLISLFPRKEWFLLTYRFIEYGRNVCPARRHDCASHPLTKIYPKIWPSARG